MKPHNLNKRRDPCVAPWCLRPVAELRLEPTGQHGGRHTPPITQHPFTTAGRVPGLKSVPSEGTDFSGTMSGAAGDRLLRGHSAEK